MCYVFFYDTSSPGNVPHSRSFLLSVFIWKQTAISLATSSLVSEDGTIISRCHGQVPGSLDVTCCVHNLGLTFIDLPNYWILLPFFLLLFSFFPPQRKTSQFLSTSLWGRYFNAHFKTKTVFVHSHSYSWKVSLQAGQRGRKTLGFVQERPHRCKKAHTTFPLFNPMTHRQSGWWAFAALTGHSWVRWQRSLLHAGAGLWVGRPVTPAAGWRGMAMACGRKWGSWSKCQSFIAPLC